MNDFLTPVFQWSSIDTWIVVTAALCAMACAIPGSFLLLRRQSMMGDALSHSVLLGIAVAFLIAFAIKSHGWISASTYEATWHTTMFAGAILIGVATAVLTEVVRRAGRVESSAALGVAYTSLFALGLLLIRLVADQVHLDPACVIYGNIEAVALDRVGPWGIPRGAVMNGAMLSVNLLLLGLFFKELRIATFDPGLADALGFRSTWIHYGLMAVTAATVVAAFESVGSILVIAMLIVPPATAFLLTRRLWPMIAASLMLAAGSSILGHVAAITLPAAIFGPLGFPTVRDASTAGMMAMAAGLLLVVAIIASPTQGLVSRGLRLVAWQLRVAGEDILGLLYRLEEMQLPAMRSDIMGTLREGRALSSFFPRIALTRLERGKLVRAGEESLELTPRGRRRAQSLVRSHRLWESYLETHFDVSHLRQHVSAHETEHFIDGQISDRLAAQLDAPETDPHGRDIPPPPEESTGAV